MKSSRLLLRKKTFAFRQIIVSVVLFGAMFITTSSFMQSGRAPNTTVQHRLSKQKTAVKSKAKRDRGAAGEATSVTAPNAIAAASNYVFTTATDASFTDMSSGTTQLIGPDQDDRTSQVNPIGFDFYFDGVRQDRFSVSTNGTLRFGKLAASDLMMQPLGSSNQSLITPYGADQRTHIGDGQVHFKLTGTEGNRVLVVEWLNMQADFHGQGTVDLTYQLRLSETTGSIEFVYGSMAMSNVGAADVGPQIGFSSGSDPGMIGSIDAPGSGAPTPSFDGGSASPVSNAYAFGPIPVLTSGGDGSRRTFMLTPPAAGSPGALLFSDVTTTAMTLNWGDTANELGFAIYLSTDVGVTYNFVAVTGPDTINYIANGLRGGTPYFWRVCAVTEGGTNFIGNNQTTTTQTVNASIGSGAWSNPAIWSNASVPTEDEAVLIDTGDTVTIQNDVVAYSVQVPSGSTLEFEDTQPRVLTIGTDVIVQSGGVFRSNASGTATGHTLNLKGDLLNEGTLDFSTNGNTAGAGITFSGTGEQTFSGTGNSNIRLVTVQKGVQSSVVHFQPDNLTVQGVTDDSVTGWLEPISGTIEIGGTFPMTNRTFTIPSYEIPQNAGFWLNNPNYVVAAQTAANARISGLLRMTQGVLNVGTTVNNRVNTDPTAEFTIEGGTVNIAGRLLGTNNGINPLGQNPIVYNQSGGTFNVATVGNSINGPNNGSFTLSAESTFNMSGGTINLVQASSAGDPYDYVNNATFVAAPVQGTLRVGTADSASNSVYALRGKIPNFVIDNNATDKVAVVRGQVNLRGTTFMPINATFVIDGEVCVVEGSTFTNNGAIIGNAANSHLYFLGGNGPTFYSGTGVVFQPLAFFQIDNAAGVTLDPSINQIIVTETDIFAGGLTGSDKLTLGVGGASNAVVQFGDDGLQTVNGFDVPPVFNAGTGGVTLRYAPEPTGRTTGNEVPPSRTLNQLLISNPNNIDIAGGNITVNGEALGSIALDGGRVITGVNTLYFNTVNGSVVRSTGYVDGFFRMSYAAAGSKIFDVGTANGYSPVTINSTAGAFPVDFQVKANEGPQPNIVSPASALQRYWNLDAFDSFTADITLRYLDIDVPPTQAENTLVIAKFNGSWTFPGGTVDTATNTATVNGISSFSAWTLTAPLAPTAAPATISGLVTRSDGMPLGGVTVNLSGGKTSRTITDGNGQYRFDNVDTGAFYTVSPGLANYSFSPASRSFSLVGNKADAIFTADATDQTQNPLNGGDFFVRQQYLDFLGREPDLAGWLYWSDQIAGCGLDQNCERQKRLDVSAAFFMSEEFQQSGNYIYRLYRAGFSRQLTYAEFTDDHKKVIGGADLESLRTQFAEEFVQRPEFTAKYQNAVMAETFVDAVLQGVISHAQVDLSSQREALLTAYTSGADLNHSRSAVLKAVADSTEFKTAVYNPSFVLMEYFGYLRREVDQDGFAFWVNVLNAEQGRAPGNYRGMVCSFVTSAEYQQRFSRIVTRSNSECGQ